MHGHAPGHGLMHRRPLLLITRLRWAGSARCSSSAQPASQHSRLRQNREDLLHKRVSAVELAQAQLQRLQGQQDSVKSFVTVSDEKEASVGTCARAHTWQAALC